MCVCTSTGAHTWSSSIHQVILEQPEQAELNHAEFRSQEIHPGFLHGKLETQTLELSSAALPRPLAGSEVNWPGHELAPQMGCQHGKWLHLACCNTRRGTCTLSWLLSIISKAYYFYFRNIFAKCQPCALKCTLKACSQISHLQGFPRAFFF